jgi:hypothetical protein
MMFWANADAIDGPARVGRVIDESVRRAASLFTDEESEAASSLAES